MAAAPGTSWLLRQGRGAGADRWLLGSALIATVWFGQVTTTTAHETWARLAGPAYLVAFVVSLVPRLRAWAPLLAVLGAVLLPLAWLVAEQQAQPEVAVIVDGARALLATGTPYRAAPGTVEDFRPYFPLLFAFGVPRALGVPAFPGDPRIWMDAALLLVLVRVLLDTRDETTGSSRSRPFLLLLAFPVISLAMCVSAIDLPMTAACVLALLYSATGHLRRAGVAAGAAILMKPVALVLLGLGVIALLRTRGPRAAAAFGLTAAGVVLLVIGPVLLRDARGFLVNTVVFPAGLADVPSPAQSPFPGVLLAGVQPAGGVLAVGLMAVAVCVAAVYTWRRPPRDAAALSVYVAVTLSLLFLLAPASRAGYFVLPICLWLLSRRQSAATAPEAARTRR